MLIRKGGRGSSRHVISMSRVRDFDPYAFDFKAGTKTASGLLGLAVSDPVAGCVIRSNRDLGQLGRSKKWRPKSCHNGIAEAGHPQECQERTFDFSMPVTRLCPIDAPDKSRFLVRTAPKSPLFSGVVRPHTDFCRVHQCWKKSQRILDINLRGDDYGFPRPAWLARLGPGARPNSDQWPMSVGGYNRPTRVGRTP